MITKAGFGVGCVTAPAYILHRKLSLVFTWYSFGTSDYIFQGLLLAFVCAVVGRVRFKYLMSFATAVLYGLCVDLWTGVMGGLALYGEMPQRIISYSLGIVISSFAIALFFRTYMPLQVYELFVSALSARFKVKTNVFKYCYDIGLLLFGIALMLFFFGRFDLTMIGAGTIISAVVNAPLIALFGRLLDSISDFSPALPRLEGVIGNNG